MVFGYPGSTFQPSEGLTRINLSPLKKYMRLFVSLQRALSTPLAKSDGNPVQFPEMGLGYPVSTFQSLKGSILRNWLPLNT